MLMEAGRIAVLKRGLKLGLGMGVVLGLNFVLMLGLASPAAAQDIKFRGFGLRAGVSDSPDQFVFGAQADMGELLPRLRLRPSLDLGLGDDTTSVALTVPAQYVFPVQGGFSLYAGGGIAVTHLDSDREGSQLEIAPVAQGGVEWPAAAAGDVFVELAVSGGDAADLKLMVGWMF